MSDWTHRTTTAADAVALIGDLEGMDRGRYAGPVGWMDTAGDGEWAIALRSAELTAAFIAGGRS